jgi:electron transfer flavoprotein beta subunit
MKIVVAVKQVPERDAAVRVAVDGRSIDESDVEWTMNEPDAYALEEALQLKERDGEGEVVVLCAGPERVTSTLREALAKGADRAIHVVTPEEGDGSLSSRDTLGVAKLLAEAIKT